MGEGRIGMVVVVVVGGGGRDYRKCKKKYYKIKPNANKNNFHAKQLLKRM